MPRKPQGPAASRGASADRDAAGHFLPGNRFWEPASKLAGRPRFFDDPEDLRAAILRYFEWNDENHLYRDELLAFQGRAVHEPVPLPRVLTQIGLCVHLGIGLTTWKGWRRDRDDLAEVIEWAEMVIAEHQMQLGFSGQANPAIVSRVLGLADKREVTGADGGPIQTEDVSRDVESFTGRMARLAAAASGGGDGPADAGGEG